MSYYLNTVYSEKLKNLLFHILLGSNTEGNNTCFSCAACKKKKKWEDGESKYPQEDKGVLPNNNPPPVAPAGPAQSTTRLEQPFGKEAVTPTPEHRASKEDGDFRQVSTPSQGENTGQRTASSGGRVQRPVPAARPSAGSEQGFERSPLHPHYQAKVVGRVSGSPAREGKNNDSSSHGTPGRSRLRPTTRGDESPDEGPTIPRFGEWDENDPQSAENFSHIFDKVREERNSGAGNISGTPKHPSISTRLILSLFSFGAEMLLPLVVERDDISFSYESSNFVKNVNSCEGLFYPEMVH
ncbi:UNVERIFIED_CONTAM: RPM1-interacting protein 4 [Sesamum calycinum]|uniref:RPM1-interacting protein 4 n=1 Tax=Sesamum calycinum TaxID=2727403 RepID=A0AAW2SCS9_9LAMI